MWSVQGSVEETTAVDATGNRPTLLVPEYGKAARAAGKQEEANPMPYVGKTAPLATLYEGGNLGGIQAWLDNLMSRPPDERPNAKQYDILKHIAARVAQEWEEERAGLIGSSTQDPLFEVVHGLPGTGKSRVIGWVRELFKEALGWTNNNQFVCLAFQNKMAGEVDGSTIHHWAEIPINADDGRQKKSRDIGVVFLRCQNLRWIIVDEISMVSAELLAQLERHVTQ